MNDLKHELMSAERNLNLMRENRKIVDLNGDIVTVQQWITAYAALETNIQNALDILEREDKGQ